jgi:hypothetical protein
MGHHCHYTYPTRQDSKPVPKQDILMDVDLCTSTERIYMLRAEENDQINKKYVFFYNTYD